MSGISFEETCTNLTLTDAQLAGIGAQGDTYDTIIPFVVWREIILGKRWRNVFRRAVLETDILIGQAGNILEVPVLDRDEFTARTASESAIDTYGFCKDRLSPDKVEISIGDVVYNATRISDILREDSPSLQWVKASLQKMGDSIEHFIDTAIRNVLIAGVAAGNIQGAAVAGVLDFDDVIDAKALMHATSMWMSEGGPFMLFVNPAQEADLLKDATFEHIERYEAGSIPFDPREGSICRMPCVLYGEHGSGSRINRCTSNTPIRSRRNDGMEETLESRVMERRAVRKRRMAIIM